ncbi:hypothetical protein D0Y65_016056, partial [Glycine soja]
MKHGCGSSPACPTSDSHRTPMRVRLRNLRLLSRNTPQYHQEETKMWDVAGDDFGSLDDCGILEIASLSLDEPELEGVFFNDD